METVLDKLPPNISESITCKMCSQPMTLLKVNDYIVFWVHHGPQLKICRHIAFKTSYLDFMKQTYNEKKEHLAGQIVKNDLKMENKPL